MGTKSNENDPRTIAARNMRAASAVSLISLMQKIWLFHKHKLWGSLKTGPN